MSMNRTFDPHDEDTWSPELRISVAALDEVTNPDEVSYLLGYAAGAVEGVAEEAGVDLDLSDLLDAASARMVAAWRAPGLARVIRADVPDPGLAMEDAAETASDGGEL